MRMITLLTFALFSLICKAPEYRTLYIARTEAINRYDPLVKAITRVESMDGKYTYNPKEDAVGWFQIRQCRVDHYNQLTGSHYVLNDFYDYIMQRERVTKWHLRIGTAVEN
jgi:hypothetical protein